MNYLMLLLLLFHTPTPNPILLYSFDSYNRSRPEHLIHDYQIQLMIATWITGAGPEHLSAR